MSPKGGASARPRTRFSVASQTPCEAELAPLNSHSKNANKMCSHESARAGLQKLSEQMLMPLHSLAKESGTISFEVTKAGAEKMAEHLDLPSDPAARMAVIQEFTKQVILNHLPSMMNAIDGEASAVVRKTIKDKWADYMRSPYAQADTAHDSISALVATMDLMFSQGPMPVREQPENEDPKAYLWEQRPSTSDGRGMDRVDSFEVEFEAYRQRDTVQPDEDIPIAHHTRILKDVGTQTECGVHTEIRTTITMKKVATGPAATLEKQMKKMAVAGKETPACKKANK